MIQLGRTYSNLMVALSGTNSKLRHRQLAILREATGASGEACRAVLARCAGDLRLALLCLLAGLEPESAAVTLAGAGGSVRAALSAARDGDRDER
jgi:N-acetylmuramic acid 6-phosphate etherase